MQRTLMIQRSLLRRRLVDISRHSAGSERIALDGSLDISFSTSAAPGAANAATAAETSAASAARRPPLVPPDARALAEAQLENLVDFVESSRGGLLVITGAGISTEAGLPDYRSPGGAYATGFKPLTHQQFLASSANRRRYWARAFAGWEGFSRAEPAAGHVALARLQRRGWVADIVSQNVDRLHTKAGSPRVVELHGSTHDVVCLACGAVAPRAPLQRRMAELNPGAAARARARWVGGAEGGGGGGGLGRPSLYVSAAAAAGREQQHQQQQQQEQQGQRRPDGDAETGAPPGEAFVVPPCPSCGASAAAGADVALKPDVVFFGDGVPKATSERALRLAEGASAVLVVGTSLRVWSAFRLVKAAAEGGTPIAVLTSGPTRADEQLSAGSVSLRLDALVGEALARLERHPRLQVPPVC